MTPRWTVLAVRALHDAGLLTDVQLAKALAVCTQNDKDTTWNAATAPGGLTQVSCNVIENFDDESPDSYSSFALNLILTSADTPVYFNYQDGQDTTHLIADAAYLQKYSTLLGLDSFADWQYPDWRAAVQDFGVAAYSETAQLYLTANCRYGITLSAASMTPQDYADLDALYHLPALLPEAVHLQDFLRRMLEVTVHNCHHIAGCLRKSCKNSCLFPKIT